MDINDIKVGMRLKIKDELPGDPTESDVGYCEDMSEYLGRTYTVSEIFGYYDSVKFDEIHYSWLSSWIEPVGELNENTDESPNIHSIIYNQ